MSSIVCPGRGIRYRVTIGACSRRITCVHPNSRRTSRKADGSPLRGIYPKLFTVYPSREVLASLTVEIETDDNGVENRARYEPDRHTQGAKLVHQKKHQSDPRQRRATFG